MSIDYVNDLTISQGKLKELKEEFNYVKSNDEYVKTIERLLKHLEQLLYVCARSPTSITIEILDADAEYFKLNIEGLGKVLDAIRKSQ